MKRGKHLNKWEIMKRQWLGQALSNIFFGLTLIMITLSYLGFSAPVLRKIGMLYLSIYFFIFVPFYGILPVLMLRYSRKVVVEVEKGRKPEKKEIQRTIKQLLNLPGNLGLLTFVTVWTGFGIGGAALWFGLVPEIMPFINVFLISCISIGFVVSIIHAFLNYIFMEGYLSKTAEFLVSLYPDVVQEAKPRPFPLFSKILVLVTLTAVASQMSIWIPFSAKVGMRSMQEFRSALLHTSMTATLTFLYVIVITVLFSRNVLDPLKRVIDWAGDVVKGETGKEMFLFTNDEISEAVEHLREMVREMKISRDVLEVRVKARTRELKELTERQEEIIEERTEELQKRLKELEKFRKLVVGREEKMMELKKEIKSLKREIKRKES